MPGNPLTGNQIGLGGGCHWCTEAVFQALRGVEQVSQGFIRSASPDDTYSEAVLVTFNPQELKLADLIEVHLRSHASTSQHSMRGKYRSAVYVFSPEQALDAKIILSTLQKQFEAPLITRVLAFDGFEISQERFQNYFKKNNQKPFCKRHIDPKLDKLRADYARLLDDS